MDLKKNWWIYGVAKLRAATLYNSSITLHPQPSRSRSRSTVFKSATVGFCFCYASASLLCHNSWEYESIQPQFQPGFPQTLVFICRQSLPFLSMTPLASKNGEMLFLLHCSETWFLKLWWCSADCSTTQWPLISIPPLPNPVYINTNPLPLPYIVHSLKSLVQMCSCQMYGKVSQRSSRIY